jgi:hypothetical protein
MRGLQEISTDLDLPSSASIQGYSICALTGHDLTNPELTIGQRRGPLVTKLLTSPRKGAK